MVFEGFIKKEVRILLVGDRNVGKTSLILSLVSEEFPFDVPSKAEEITIPGDLTPEKIPTCIVDYSAVEQTDAMLEAEIRRSNAICVVYAVDDEDSLDSVTDHWLPLIRKILQRRSQDEHDEGDEDRASSPKDQASSLPPVVLVGNKVDLVGYSTMDLVLPIMNEYEEIETCVECSAKNLKNISEMFYFAQKAVLHPSAPLWNHHLKDLTDRCKRALKRIFRICDTDNDGLLSDLELSVFQRKCFGMDLDPNTVSSLKSVIDKNCPEGLQNNCLNIKGFFALHKLFIQRGRHETTWTILRKFGYDDRLSIQKDYLFPDVKVPVGSTVELSWNGYEFLTRTFEKYDRDRDGALNHQELVNAFSTCPAFPWNQEVYHTVALNHGLLGLSGYLGLWTLTTLLDSSRTMEYLAYLGYSYLNSEESQLGALTVTRDKNVDLARRQASRNVYKCRVVGPTNVGKTAFCQGLLGKTREDVEAIHKSDIPNHTISTLQVYGQEKYLALEEIDPRNLADAFGGPGCDAYCLMYDVSNPRSFKFAARVYLKYLAGGNSKKMPVQIVGNKSDKIIVRQDFELQPEVFCAKYRLPPPLLVSTSKGRTKKDVYTKLATMAAFPHLRPLGLVASEARSLVKIAISLAFAAIGGLFFVKIMRSTRTPSTGLPVSSAATTSLSSPAGVLRLP